MDLQWSNRKLKNLSHNIRGTGFNFQTGFLNLFFNNEFTVLFNCVMRVFTNFIRFRIMKQRVFRISKQEKVKKLMSFYQLSLTKVFKNDCF